VEDGPTLAPEPSRRQALELIESALVPPRAALAWIRDDREWPPALLAKNLDCQDSEQALRQFLHVRNAA
jgi:hypothetical protein